MEKKCCFIILHYQTTEETLECIRSVKSMNHQGDIGIIVIDNASPNGSGKILQSQFENDEQIVVICNGHNEGFSRGNNIGCKIARDMWNPSFYVITNNDTVFIQKNLLELIEQEYQNSRFAILGPDIIRVRDNLHQSPIDREPPDFLRVWRTIIMNFLIYIMYPMSCVIVKRYAEKADRSNASGYDRYQRNVCLMGACMIFSKAFVKKKNCIFDPETQFYYEEYILSLYCRENNELTVYNPNIHVLHEEGKATEIISSLENEKIKFRVKNILESAKIYKKYLLKCKREKSR